jgi:hypothetical protein
MTAPRRRRRTTGNKRAATSTTRAGRAGARTVAGGARTATGRATASAGKAKAASGTRTRAAASTTRTRKASRTGTAKTTTKRRTGRAASRGTTSRRARVATQPRRSGRQVAGARTFVLDVPFELRYDAFAAGASYDRRRSLYTWIGAELPAPLAPFDSMPWSWERWVEDKLNRAPRPVAGSTGELSPRPHQQDAVALIQQAMRAGRPGFVLGDDVGLGKTITAWEAVLRTPRSREVLIVCPLSVIPVWRDALTAMGVGDRRILIVNYDRLKRLLIPPAKARQAKRRRTRNKRIVANGKPAVRPSLVILDEAHLLANPDSQRSIVADRLVAEARFRLWLSATLGETPLQLSYLAEAFTHATGEPVPRDGDAFGHWCQAKGMQVRKGRFGWVWEPNPDDEERVRQLLFGGKLPVGVRRVPTDIAGWPEVQRIPMPIALDPKERWLYAAAWAEFRRQLRLRPRGNDRDGGWLATLRFRQKASLLRVPGVVNAAVDLLAKGRQVAISVEFLESLEALRVGLEAKQVPCAVITGEVTGRPREEQRLAFQHDKVRVVLFTITEGINLHQGQYPDSRAPRTLILHDVRTRARPLAQIEGRTHRDGQFAPVLYAYAEATREQQVVEVAVRRMRAMKGMHGDDTAMVREMEAALRD